MKTSYLPIDPEYFDLFEKEIEKGKNSFTLDWDEGSIITIDESNLTINMIKGGELWTANCKR